MDAQNDTGSEGSRGQRVCYINVLGPELTAELEWLAGFEPKAFTRLVKAISQGNMAVENTVLRRWRVR